MNIIRQDYEVLFTKDFLQKVSKDDYKIVLYDRTIIKVIPSEKIEKVRSSGKEVNESLANIVEIVRNINRNEITEDEKFLLIDNFKWFNRKIKVLNQSILDNQFKIKMLDNRNLFVEIEEKKQFQISGKRMYCLTQLSKP